MNKAIMSSAPASAHIYTAPSAWIVGIDECHPLLNTSDKLPTEVQDGYADTDGRSNGWNGFEEAPNNSSLWDNL